MGRDCGRPGRSHRRLAVIQKEHTYRKQQQERADKQPEVQMQIACPDIEALGHWALGYHRSFLANGLSGVVFESEQSGEERAATPLEGVTLGGFSEGGRAVTMSPHQCATSWNSDPRSDYGHYAGSTFSMPTGCLTTI